MSYGPNPWLQAHWDARAAVNFMAGGSGGGLVLCAALLEIAGAYEPLWIACLGLGLVLIAAGLTAVWFEIGRPLRAVNVMFNARTSWMTRESLVAPLVFAAGLALFALDSVVFAALLVALALAFVFTQARILRAARGIAAWSEPRVVGWIVATGLTEGAGLALALAVVLSQATPIAGWAVVSLALVRYVLWADYARHLSALPAAAVPAIDETRRWLLAVGFGLPLALVALATVSGSFAGVALALAGVAAWFAGWRAKFLLLRRAAYNRGFAISHLPVRGRR
ncbi:MAG: dimethyl sulfoxide reductase anchor subunit [Burkholderiaceae bacterium]|nr:dimethyl sulfoxide reductase anchor subunit [Burkholderiaceae bacterium]